MQTAFIKSPLGITKVAGDEKAITEISVLSKGEITIEIPTNLQKCIFQLREYFEG